MYSPSLHGFMQQVKSTHCTIDHFDSVKYAKLVDLTEIANSPVPIAAALYQKFIFLNCDTTCRSYCSKNDSMTLFGTYYVCYNEISL